MHIITIDEIRSRLYDAEICMFMEYPFGDENSIRYLSLTEGQLYNPYFGDIEIFELLAGCSLSCPGVKPRGLPSDMSTDVFYVTYRAVIDQSDIKKIGNMNYITIDDYRNDFFFRGNGNLIINTPDFAIPTKYGYVKDLNPDVFCHSYLYFSEITSLFLKAGILIAELNPIFQIVINTLELLTKNHGDKSRLVFWFRS